MNPKQHFPQRKRKRRGIVLDFVEGKGNRTDYQNCCPCPMSLGLLYRARGATLEGEGHVLSRGRKVQSKSSSMVSRVGRSGLWNPAHTLHTSNRTRRVGGKARRFVLKAKTERGHLAPAGGKKQLTTGPDFWGRLVPGQRRQGPKKNLR